MSNDKNSEVDTKDEASEVDTKDKASEADTKDKALEVDFKDEALEVDTKDDALEADTKDEASEADAKDEASEVDSKDEASEVDTKDQATKEDTKDEAIEVSPEESTKLHLECMKQKFYEMYKELYDKNRNGGCPLIMQAHYNEYVSWIWAYPGMPPASRTPAICNEFQKYHLLSPVNGASLFRDNRCVATFETVFTL